MMVPVVVEEDGSVHVAAAGGYVHRPVLLDDHRHHHAPEGQLREPLLSAGRGGDVNLLVLGTAGDELVARSRAVRAAGLGVDDNAHSASSRGGPEDPDWFHCTPVALQRLNRRRPLAVTSSDVPMSANTASQRLTRPSGASTRKSALTTSEKTMFCQMTRVVRRARRMVSGTAQRSSPS